MRLLRSGASASKAEVLGITPRGLWICVHGVEHFLSYQDFPWFKNARVMDVYQVELRHDHFLRWEKLDIDLEIESLENLERYPLSYHR